MTEESDDYVSIELRKRITYMQVLLGHGACKDYVDYQNMVGQIKGIEYTLDIISELRKKLEEEDNKV